MKTIFLSFTLLLLFNCNITAQTTIKRKVSETNKVSTSKSKIAYNSYKAVDLGLPSGTKWADRNVGAKSPEAYGGLYPFGNPWCTMNKNDGFYDVPNIIGTEYDVAKAKMGGKWRTPSYAQLKELKEHCSFTKMNVKDAVVAKVVGPNGNYILLPLAGVMYNYGRSQGGLFGIYQAGDRQSNGNVYELQLWLGNDPVSIGDYSKPGDGCPVRGVYK